MTLLLRERKIPARFVQGFLPGDLNQLDGRRGDPERSRRTPGSRSTSPATAGSSSTRPAAVARRVEPLPSGDRPVGRLAAAVPAPRPSDGSPDPERSPDRARPVRRRRHVRTSGRRRCGPFIVVALLLLVVVGGVAFVAWQRGPRGPTTPDGAYAGVARLGDAARLRAAADADRRTSTPTALGDVLPNIRPELQTVATAKVEVAYGRRTLGDERIRALRDFVPAAPGRSAAARLFRRASGRGNRR